MCYTTWRYNNFFSKSIVFLKQEENKSRSHRFVRTLMNFYRKLRFRCLNQIFYFPRYGNYLLLGFFRQRHWTKRWRFPLRISPVNVIFSGDVLNRNLFVQWEYDIEIDSIIRSILYSSRPIRLQIFGTLTIMAIND